jgi:hypothetical protein
LAFIVGVKRKEIILADPQWGTSMKICISLEELFE